MLRAPALAFLVVTVATAAWAEDGAPRPGSYGPERWLLEGNVDADVDRARNGARLPTAGADPLTRFIEHCKRNPIGLRPIVTLLPTEADDRGRAELPTLALFARAQGRTLVSLTHVQARPDDGQEVVMQRTLVSDLLAGRRFSLTVYEDHVISEAATRLMGVGTRLTFRPSGWPFRVEVLASYDLDAGASGYLAISGVFGAPPLPVGIAR